MATTVNFLSDKQGLYSYSRATQNTVNIDSYDYEWSTTNSTSSLIATEFFTVDRYTIRIAPSTTSDIVLSLSSVELVKSDNGKTLSFNCRIKPPSEVTITATLSIDGQTVPDGHLSTIPGGIYNAIQSNTVVVPDDGIVHYASIEINIAGHQNQNIYFTHPNLIDDRAFYSNYFVAAARNLMPDFYWEIDSAQTFPTAPLHKLMDILTTRANESRLEFQEIFPYEIYEYNQVSLDTESWKYSTLVNPSFVKTEYIPWLAQFTGNKIVKNITDGNGNLHFADSNRARGFLEWQLGESSYGRGAGTRKALISAASQVLGQTKDLEDSTYSVSLTANYLNDPWSILIQTLENETPDASTGDSSVLVLTAVEPARPLGYKIYHNTISEFFFTLNDITYGILDDFQLGDVSLPTAAPSISSASVGATAVTLYFAPLSATGDDGGGVISNYQYSLSTNGGSTYGAYQVLSPGKGSPPITITGLSSSQAYYVKLKAINEAGVSTFESAAFAFTTL